MFVVVFHIVYILFNMTLFVRARVHFSKFHVFQYCSC